MLVYSQEITLGSDSTNLHMLKVVLKSIICKLKLLPMVVCHLMQLLVTDIDYFDI